MFFCFSAVFGVIFGLIWVASFTGYFDKARVRRIAKIMGIAALTAFLTMAVVVFMFGLEHSIF